MSSALTADNPELKKGLFELFRDFFGRAERKRRWSLDEIPYDQTNRHMNPAITYVVESFCAVELYLPDYIAEALPMIRTNRAWSSFHVNWGYEESKHSVALANWLIQSRQRTPEHLAEIQNEISYKIWDPPQDSGAAMLIYAMCQELATWIHYRNLRELPDVKQDPALGRLLELIAIDERAHHTFYKRVVQLFLTVDRKETISQLTRIMSTFAMPAVHLFAESKQRETAIRSLNIFSEDIFVREVYMPVLEMLDVKKAEIKACLPNMKGRTSS